MKIDMIKSRPNCRYSYYRGLIEGIHQVDGLNKKFRLKQIIKATEYSLVESEYELP